MNIRLHRRRVYRRMNTLDVMDELDRMATMFEIEGWEVQRSFLGTIILELKDGFVYYVPMGAGIEEILFEKVEGAML